MQDTSSRLDTFRTTIKAAGTKASKMALIPVGLCDHALTTLANKWLATVTRADAPFQKPEPRITRARNNTGPADFSHATLCGVDFSGENLPLAVFTNATLRGADFSGANLSGVDFTNADLSGADFSHATLDYATLSGANLSETDFSGVDLQNATMKINPDDGGEHNGE